MNAVFEIPNKSIASAIGIPMATSDPLKQVFETKDVIAKLEVITGDKRLKKLLEKYDDKYLNHLFDGLTKELEKTEKINLGDLEALGRNNNVKASLDYFINIKPTDQEKALKIADKNNKIYFEILRITMSELSGKEMEYVRGK